MAVEEAIVGLNRNQSGAEEANGKAWMEDLKASHRYVVDVWPRN
jgi:sulfite reductase alpha subunit-like flavoprotein